MAFTPYNAGLARLRWYCCKLYQAAAAMSLFFDQNYGRLYCNLQIMLLPLIRFWSYQRGDLLMQPAPSQIPLVPMRENIVHLKTHIWTLN